VPAQRFRSLVERQRPVQPRDPFLDHRPHLLTGQGVDVGRRVQVVATALLLEHVGHGEVARLGESADCS